MAVVEERMMAPDDLPAEIEGFLAGVDREAVAEAVESLPGIDPMLAPRIARRRARIAQRLAERRAAVAAEIRRLTEWADFQDARDEMEAERLDLILGNILAAERARDPKRKTLTLPYGVTVKARAQQPEWTCDEGVVLAWVNETRLISFLTEPKLKWGDLKRCLEVTGTGKVVLHGTGELVPGVTVEDRPEKIEVKVTPEVDA